MTLEDKIWTLMFGAIVFLSVVGNTIVLYIIIKNRRMWNVQNYFLANLAVADLGMAVLNTMPSFRFMRDGEWDLGLEYCRFNTFSSILTVNANIFTLLGLTINRQKAIVTPLAPKTSSISLFIGILMIWLISALIALPTAIYSELIVHRYNMFLFLINYLMPLCLMTCFYARMGIVLNADQIGEENNSTRISRHRKKKVVKMFALLVIIFAVCWLPYQLYFLLSHYLPVLTRHKYTKTTFLSFYWLAMTNCCINPLIYYFWNKRFRNYFDDILSSFFPKCCCRNRQRDDEFELQSTLRINNNALNYGNSYSAIVSYAPRSSRSSSRIKGGRSRRTSYASIRHSLSPCKNNNLRQVPENISTLSITYTAEYTL